MRPTQRPRRRPRAAPSWLALLGLLWVLASAAGLPQAATWHALSHLSGSQAGKPEDVRPGGHGDGAAHGGCDLCNALDLWDAALAPMAPPAPPDPAAQPAPRLALAPGPAARSAHWFRSRAPPRACASR